MVSKRTRQQGLSSSTDDRRNVLALMLCQDIKLPFLLQCVCVCVCVCEREREGERERVLAPPPHPAASAVSADNSCERRGVSSISG
jgi:hypothetical protein